MELIVRVGNRKLFCSFAATAATPGWRVDHRRFRPRFAFAAGGFLAGTVFLISGTEGGAGLVS